MVLNGGLNYYLLAFSYGSSHLPFSPLIRSSLDSLLRQRHAACRNGAAGFRAPGNAAWFIAARACHTLRPFSPAFALAQPTGRRRGRQA